MSAEQPLQMADLLPLPTPPIPFYDGWLAAIVIALLLAGLLIWRYQRNPYRRLQQALQQGQSPRAIAHRLAELPLPEDAAQQLDHLRFQAAPPDATALTRLINRGLHG